MPQPQLRSFKEPLSAQGEVLLSHNHICLLNGLYDRPHGRATSTVDLVNAAIPYRHLFSGTPAGLQKGAQTMHPAWVKAEYRGSRRTWTLTRRGRGIVERTVPAWIRGYGPYCGVAEWRNTRVRRRDSSA